MYHSMRIMYGLTTKAGLWWNNKTSLHFAAVYYHSSHVSCLYTSISSYFLHIKKKHAVSVRWYILKQRIRCIINTCTILYYTKIVDNIFLRIFRITIKHNCISRLKLIWYLTIRNGIIFFFFNPDSLPTVFWWKLSFAYILINLVGGAIKNMKTYYLNFQWSLLQNDFLLSHISYVDSYLDFILEFKM